jgi:hypothetical protein
MTKLVLRTTTVNRRADSGQARLFLYAHREARPRVMLAA